MGKFSLGEQDIHGVRIKSNEFDSEDDAKAWVKKYWPYAKWAQVNGRWEAEVGFNSLKIERYYIIEETD